MRPDYDAKMATLPRPKPVEAPWTEFGPIACRLLNRTFAGKGVLHLGWLEPRSSTNT